MSLFSLFSHPDRLLKKGHMSGFQRSFYSVFFSLYLSCSKIRIILPVPADSQESANAKKELAHAVYED